MNQKKTIQVVIALGCLLCMGCEDWGDCESGRGPIVSRELALADIHSLKLSGSDMLYISQGPRQEIIVEGEENIIDLIRLDVNKGTWDISTRGCVRRHKRLVYYVTLPEIRSLSLSGSGDIIGENTLTSPEIEFDLAGSGSITAEVEADVDVEIKGSGKLVLSGVGDWVEIDLSGSGECDALALEANDVRVKIQGSGSAYVTAQNILEVEIRGSGDVHYRGNPAIASSISGSGKLKKVDRP